jgi:hypothetical protein
MAGIALDFVATVTEAKEPCDERLLFKIFDIVWPEYEDAVLIPGLP